MPLKRKLSDAPSPAVARQYGNHGLDGSQTQPVSSASMWVADEVGAAIAHQMNEPLTALLLYLYEIKHRIESSAAPPETGSVGSLLESAIRETKRACDIMDRLDYSGDRLTGPDGTIPRGNNTLESWRRTLNSPDSPRAPVLVRPPLTPRESEVMALIAGGASNKEGSHQLGISTRTFEVHRARVMEKIGARNAADLVRIALSDAT
ncbi:helix-turn-helix transcriptional regulator [Rhodopseudomonas palustris]|uniref:helix-turn-helix transcriptional regulator n=1 Tax=Rhodopseudomonas palustris TaxID=1076 RepID=UPI002ACE492A|nr:helix-turn-helix transcriptional regulator [Rhodopseudomonas palustris]WQG99803.1 helix-turn-helix transcriptional regulator [Rhodopseudomonas palustris]